MATLVELPTAGPVELPVLRAVADPRSLRVIVLPTEQCNFRCTYCYEDFEIGRMSDRVVGALKRWLRSRVEDVDHLTLSWFGGEPTLALDLMLDVASEVRDAYVGAGKEFSSGVTTNAYKLTPEIFPTVVRAGITDFQITLDGPAEVHDSRRVRASGQGTFSVIWGNLVAMAARAEALPPFRVGLRLHYDRNSAYALPSLLEAIKSELMPSGRFSVNFHELERLGGEKDEEIEVATEAEHEFVRRLVGELQADVDAAGSKVALDVPDYVCYAARANAFVLRADGRLAKCTVALNDRRNDIGRLNADGTITLFEPRLAPWMRGLETGDRATLACPLGGMPEEVPPKRGRALPLASD
jgi:uncharacterized protein